MDFTENLETWKKNKKQLRISLKNFQVSQKYSLANLHFWRS